MTIHKEGRTLLLVLLIIIIVLNTITRIYLPEYKVLQNILLGFSIFFGVVILQFFRSPTRKVIINEKQIIAPADGKIVVIEEVTETEYFKANRRQISIFMSPINVACKQKPYFRYYQIFQIPSRRIFGCLASQIQYIK